MKNNNPPDLVDPNLVEQYRILHTLQENYGAGATFSRRIGEWGLKLGCESAIDYGCGKGKLADVLTKRWQIPCIKYDPAIEKYSQHPDAPVDLVVCMDVLEHLTEETLPGVLAEIDFLAIKGIFMNVSCRRAVHKLPDGSNCHTIIQDKEWWIPRIEEVLGDVEWEYGDKNRNLVVYQERA